MSAHMNFFILLKMSFSVVKVSAGVVMSPCKLIIFPPTFSQVKIFSLFRSYFSHSYLIGDCASCWNVSLGTKKIVLILDSILVSTTCASHPVSFANKLYQMDLVGPLIKFL